MKDYPMSVGEGSYERQQKAVKAKLAKAAKGKSAPDILKRVSKELNHETSEEARIDCQIAHRLFEEALEQYKAGDCSWKQMVGQLCKSLDAIK